MKKLLIFITITLFFCFSMNVSAKEENSDEETDTDIEEGTKIYGEDISELSEEELKYVPKGWRDGDVKSTHDEEDNYDGADNYSTQDTYPDVNTYIKKEDFATSQLQKDINPDFEEFDYRNGNGAVEGIVAHETANDDSTIQEEIDFMGRNHENAFVHAFVDHSNIIQLHSTDLGAWGAGRYANERFVHIELVRVDTFDEFARSINNYSDFIASILYDYNLGVDSAEDNGKGTLWSHKAVSEHLGGTDHVDPHGYFEQWGYNWDEFVKLVEEKYEEKVSEADKDTSKLGHFKPGSAKIYEDPSRPEDYSKVDSDLKNKVYFIKSKAEFENETYYLISNKPSSDSGVVGWVSSKDLTTHSHKRVDNESKSFVVTGSGKAYKKAWGGNQDLVYDLSDYENKEFKVHKTETVGNNTWYRGKLDGKTVWIHSSYVTTKKESKTSKLGHLKAGADINEDAGDKDTAIDSEDYLNAVYYVKKQAEIGDSKYYLISTKPSNKKGTVGWVNTEDLTTYSHERVDNDSKSFVINGSGKAYEKAWGGKKDHVYDLSDYENKEFTVHKTETVGNNTWYRGKLDGKTVWIHSSYITAKKESKTSKLGHLKAGADINEDAGDKDTAIDSEDYLNAVYYIKKQVEIGKKTYYLISTKPSSKKGTIGWVSSGDLTTHSHKRVDSKSKSFVVNGSGNAYEKAWGGNKDHVYDLSKYKNKTFKVHKTETVGNNTWYRGKLDGKTVWVHSSYTKE